MYTPRKHSPLTLSLFSVLALFGSAALLSAELSLPNIFSDHMVLQRNQANPIFGQATPGSSITVRIADQTHRTVAGQDGRWRAHLDPLPAGGPHTIVIEGENTIRFDDVLVGEVWFAGGQSNMAWSVDRSEHAGVEIVSANFPDIRFISVPRIGSDAPQDSFDATWEICSPETVGHASAVGYFFARRIHQALGVPVGLIVNSWGGTTAESWLPRKVIEGEGVYAELLKAWDERMEGYTDETFAAELAEWEAWVEAGRPGENRPRPRNLLESRWRPAQGYNAMIHPMVGYGIRGFIWYQGESNAARAEQYRQLFPLVIDTFRDLWGNEALPFYWVQLANYRHVNDEPVESDWAELREAQTMTLGLPYTGQAVIIDRGEANDIHPIDKQTVADRLVRHALAKDYGFDLHVESPRYRSMAIEGDTITLHFDHVSEAGFRSFNSHALRGFAIAGEDRRFVWANARIVDGNIVVVRSPEVPEPVAVRYGWSNNPPATLHDRNGLPTTPFRTDDWPLSTKGIVIPPTFR